MQIKDKYPFLPTSVIRINKHKKSQDLKQNRNITIGDAYYTNSSRVALGNFDMDLAEFILKFYARQAKNIFDPFAGWGERGYVAEKLGYIYSGFDISDVCYRYAYTTYGIMYCVANSCYLDYIENNKFDFCYTCPPYWNLEKYESVPGQLSDIRDYSTFLNELKKVIEHTYRILKPISLCSWVVGDFRKQNIFYNFSHDVTDLMKQCGFTIFDKVIIDKSINYRLPIFLNQADRLGYTVKLHEYILTFKKE